MKKPIRLLIQISLAATLMAHMSGCTLFGLGVGAISGRKAAVLTDASFDSLRTGDKVAVRLMDGSIQKGTYTGKNLEALDSYALRYASWYETLGHREGILQPGDTISVSRYSGQSRTNTFVGLDENVVYLGYDGGGHEPVQLEDIESITIVHTASTSSTPCASIPDHDGAPFRSRLQLVPSGQGSIVYFAPEEIASIRVSAVSHAMTGMVVGLAIDLIILGVALQDLYSWELTGVLQ